MTTISLINAVPLTRTHFSPFRLCVFQAVFLQRTDKPSAKPGKTGQNGCKKKMTIPMACWTRFSFFLFPPFFFPASHIGQCYCSRGNSGRITIDPIQRNQSFEWRISKRRRAEFVKNTFVSTVNIDWPMVEKDDSYVACKARAFHLNVVFGKG